MVESNAILRSSYVQVATGSICGWSSVASGGRMRVFDALLVAPVGFCIIGVLIGVFTDVSLSRVWAGVAAASMAALALHWLIARNQKRVRSRR